MRDLLTRGIGVHHGGLLPIVKEVFKELIIYPTKFTFITGCRDPVRQGFGENTFRHRDFRNGTSMPIAPYLPFTNICHSGIHRELICLRSV